LNAPSFASAPDYREGLAGERLRELGRELFTGFGAIEVRDMDQLRVQRAQDRFADDGAVVAQGVDGDACDEIEVARAVLGDELGPFAGDEERTNTRIDASRAWRRTWSAGVSRVLHCGGGRSREKAGAGGGVLEHIEIANPYGPNTRLQRLRGGAQLGGHAARRNAALNHCFDSAAARVGW